MINVIIITYYTMASRADNHSTFTKLCLTHDSQKEAAVHYLYGYITVIGLPDWSRAFYRHNYINPDNTRQPRSENPSDV